MLTWDEKMTTGDARLDFQHTTIIGKLNELGEALRKTDEAGQIQTTGDILDFLEFYADWHFGEEEKIMAYYDCPFAGINKRQHQEFHTRFAEFRARWLNGEIDRSAAFGVYAELARWVADHVLRVDIKLRDYIS